MTIKLVIYDLDGTLLDAFEDIRSALNHGMEVLGLPTHSLEAVRGFVGDGIDNLVRRGLGPHHQDRFDRALELVAGYYESHPAGAASLYPGVTGTLRAIGESAVRQAILTNKPHGIARDVCEACGLARLVDAIQGEDPGHPLKPDPTSALDLMRRFEADADSTLMVGDGEADMRVARAAGIRSVGCTWGMHPRGVIESLRPDFIIESIGELPELLRLRRSRSAKDASGQVE